VVEEMIDDGLWIDNRLCADSTEQNRYKYNSVENQFLHDEPKLFEEFLEVCPISTLVTCNSKRQNWPGQSNQDTKSAATQISPLIFALYKSRENGGCGKAWKENGKGEKRVQ
jgi:hypothetical protein